MKNQDPKDILNKMIQLTQSFDIDHIRPFTQNDNSEIARKIREFKTYVGFSKIRDQVENPKIDRLKNCKKIK